MKTRAETHYETLGVETSATIVEIREAYERLRAIFAPGSLVLYSLAGPEEQREAQEKLLEAFQVLSSPEARRAYDLDLGIEQAPPAQQLLSFAEGPAPTLQWTSRGLDMVSEDAQREAIRGLAPPGSAAPTGGPAAEEPAEKEPIQLDEDDVIEVLEPEPELAAEEPGLPPIDGDTEFTGALLRALREAKGLSLRDLMARTRIGVNHLQNIEEENFALLPDRVFLRGFLLSYARELKLDPARVAKTYLRRREGGQIL